MPEIVIPFYFGLGSRYSYLAASQLDRIERERNCRFEWLPIQSGKLIRRANRGLSPFRDKVPSGQYDWDYRQRDAEAWANYYGIPYKEPDAFRVDPADLAKACWAADLEGQRKEMARRIFQAVFVESVIVTREVIAELAQDVGLDGRVLIEALDTPEVDASHEAALERALTEGAFGVPSFVVDDRLFWGNDRLPLLEAALHVK